MKNFITKKYDLIIKSIHFHDFHTDKSGNYDFNIIFELSDLQIYTSKKINGLRFDIQASVIAREEKLNHLGFTLNASFQIFVYFRKGVNREDVESFIETESNNNSLDGILRPIIAKELNRILENSKYKGKPITYKE